MDTVTLSSAVVAAITPLVAAGATELAKTAFKDVYTAIKERLKKKPGGEQAIQKFESNPTEGKDDFQEHVSQLINAEPELGRLLQEALENYNRDQHGPLVGNVNAEKAVIANKIDNVNM